MTHHLRGRHPDNAVGLNPLVVSMRYRCECAENEVLTIQVVLDKDIEKRAFLWTMERLFEDIKFEVEQHLKAGRVKA